MKQKIRMKEVSKIQEFNRIACRQNFDIDVISGRYMIDAKSILGLFSLDWSKEIYLNCHATAEESESFLKEISEYLVKEE